MALCPKCGSQVADDARFCGKCGETLAATVTPAGPPGAAPPSGPTPASAQGGMAPNVAALLVWVPLCLVGIVCAILFAFLLDPYKKDRFVRFHAWQSLAFHVCWIGLWIGLMIVISVMAAVVHIIALLALPVYLVFGLGGFILMIFMMIKANGREMYKLPVIGDWAEKQANS